MDDASYITMNYTKSNVQHYTTVNDCMNQINDAVDRNDAELKRLRKEMKRCLWRSMSGRKTGWLRH